ncbi:uncharacterized protein LOC129732436 [Wyeomyia smithii]|uniref:uncharacterized protein LOC129732436 n=1 Tax=Wyeomyia smithii TaxID=174621 RepID=UPI002467D2EA|nr:uncharacterized protein LOC129732436 [Wyeomyia smithii]
MLPLSTYLASTAPEVVTNLTMYLGGSNVAGINATLVAMGTAVTKLTASLAAMETAINNTVSAAGGSTLTATMVLNGIPTALATTINNNLNLLKSSLSDMVTPIKAIVRRITAANAFNQLVTTAATNLDNAYNTFVETITTLMSSSNLTVTNYANAAVKAMKPDWTSVTAKLAVCSTNSTLKQYVTNYTTFVTKTSTDIYTTFVGTATNTTNGVAANLTDIVTDYMFDYYFEIAFVANSVFFQIMTKIAAGSIVCSTNVGTYWLSLIASMSSSFSTCTTTAIMILNLAIAQFNNGLQVPIALNQLDSILFKIHNFCERQHCL